MPITGNTRCTHNIPLTPRNAFQAIYASTVLVLPNGRDLHLGRRHAADPRTHTCHARPEEDAPTEGDVQLE